jgi:hypothetical protein
MGDENERNEDLKELEGNTFKQFSTSGTFSFITTIHYLTEL